jgi:phosphate transport system substrate-binding protein
MKSSVMWLTRRRCVALAGLPLLAAPRPGRAEDLIVPGSGSFEHVLGSMAGVFNGRQSGHRISVPTSTGTAGALHDVESGVTPLGRVGRPLKDEERGRGLVYLPVGRDPVTFVGGAAVSVKNLTTAQVLDIYRGRITEWREVGGQPGPIRAIGREPTEVSRQAIQRHMKPFATIVYGDSVKVAHLDPQVIELLDRFPGSFGFLNRSALAACATRVSPIALDGMEATLQNLESGRYPMCVEFGLVYRTGGPGAAGRAFIDFIRSPAGTAMLRERGVQPVSPKA